MYKCLRIYDAVIDDIINGIYSLNKYKDLKVPYYHIYL